jgi:nucleoside-diphosphate-sugar epimerase
LGSDVSKAFVTGGTGFIGFHLVRALLERGDDVTCAVRQTSPPHRVAELKRLGVRLIEAELDDLHVLGPALRDCEVLYHLAGATRARNRLEFLEVNARATLKLLREAANRTTPPVVVFVSSLAAAGPSRSGSVLHESDPVRPVSQYGMSKLVAELLARSLADKVPISIVRPPMVLGPGDATSVELFRVLQRAPLHFMPGFHRRQYSLIFAEDLARGAIAVAEFGERLPPDSAAKSSCCNGDTALVELPRRIQRSESCLASNSLDGQGLYYLASDKRVTYCELGRWVAQAAGRKRILTVSVPTTLMWCMASCNEIAARVRGRATFFGWDKWREATTGDWTCSPIKAQQQLGFWTNDDFAAQIQATYSWYQEHGWL